MGYGMRPSGDDEFAMLLQQAGDEVLQRVRLTADLVERHITPVFTIDESGSANFVGTGFFTRLDRRYYLVTAAHVLDRCDFGVLLPHLVHRGDVLEHPSIVTGLKPGQTRTKDQNDLGFVRLTASELDGIGEHNFLNLRHTDDGPLADPVIVMIVLGFPARDQKVDSTTIETASTMLMTGPADERGYQLTRCDPRSHILLRYRRENILYNGTTRGSPPRVDGMSGSPVWPVSVSVDASPDSPPAIAGMITERPARYGPSLLATRATLIRHFIERFDED